MSALKSVMFATLAGIVGVQIIVTTSSAAEDALPEIVGSNKEGCVVSARSVSRDPRFLSKVCWIVGSDGASLLGNQLSGLEVVLLERQPVESTSLLTLISLPSERQWLLTDWQDEERGSLWSLWDLNSRTKVLEGQSAQEPEVGLEESNNAVRLVVFIDLMITPKNVWQDEAFGLPQVYRLGDFLEARPIRDYPEVIEKFANSADSAAKSFRSSCDSVNGPSSDLDEACRLAAEYEKTARLAEQLARRLLGGRPLDQ